MSNKKNQPNNSESANKWQDIAEEQQETVEQQTSDEPSDPECDQQENQLTALKQELEDHKESRLRMAAELQNVRERAARDVSKAHKFANEKLLNDLLPVVDSLVRGLQNIQTQDDTVKDGVKLTLDMFYKVLTQHGVEIIAPQQGDSFDPERHEAMSAQQLPDAKANTIVQLLQQGYSLNGRVVRAAMVIVAA